MMSVASKEKLEEMKDWEDWEIEEATKELDDRDLLRMLEKARGREREVLEVPSWRKLRRTLAKQMDISKVTMPRYLLNLRPDETFWAAEDVDSKNLWRLLNLVDEERESAENKHWQEVEAYKEICQEIARLEEEKEKIKKKMNKRAEESKELNLRGAALGRAAQGRSELEDQDLPLFFV